MIVKYLNCETQLYGNLGDAGLQALAAWARTCRFFNDKLEPELYDKGVIRHPYLLCWATDIGNLGLMRKVLAAKDAALLPQTGMLRFSPDHEYKDLDRTKPTFDLFKKHYRADGSVLQWGHDWRQHFEHQAWRRNRNRNRTEDINDNIYDDDDDDDGDFMEAIAREQSDTDDSIYERFHAHANSQNDNDGVYYPEPAWDPEVFFDRNIAKVVRWNHGENDQTQDNLQREAAMYWFPVHIAARNGNIPALDLLLARGAQLNMPSRGFCVDRRRPRRKRSPLSEDWWWPQTASRKYPSWTPFHVALSRGHEATAIHILNKCRHISDRLLAPGETAKDQMPPFISAFRHGCFEAAEACLTTLADDATKVDDATRLYPALGHHTLLYKVLHERGNFGRALDVLVRNGADVNRVEDGEALLVWACLRGHFKRALALVDAGARTDVIVRMNIGERGLGKLRGRGLVYICCEERRLAAYRGRQLPPKEYRTSSASRRSAAALVERILANKRTSRLVKDRWLNHAAGNNQPEIMEVLLRHGADPNAASLGQERAPLELLVRGIRCAESEEHEHVEEAVKLLVEHARRSGTPLQGGEGLFGVIIARFNRLWAYSAPIVRALLLLIKEGVVDVNERTGDGATCLTDSVFRLMRFSKSKNLSENRTYLAAFDLLKLGATATTSPAGEDQLWEMWKCLMASDRGLGDDWSRAMLRLLLEIDAEHRIFKEPRFLAKALVERRDCVLDALVGSTAPKLQLDASWRNAPGPTGLDTDRRPGWTLLHFASYAGCVEVTKRLLQEGNVDVDAVTDGGGLTALYIAIIGRDTQRSLPITQQAAPRPFSKETFRLLMEAGADPHAGGGQTAIHAAVTPTPRKDAMAEMLAKHPIRDNPAAQRQLYLIFMVREWVGSSTAWVKSDSESLKMCTELMAKHGADPNCVDDRGDSPMAWVLRHVILYSTSPYDLLFLLPILGSLVPVLFEAGAELHINDDGNSEMDLVDNLMNSVNGSQKDHVKYIRHTMYNGFRGLL